MTAEHFWRWIALIGLGSMLVLCVFFVIDIENRLRYNEQTMRDHIRWSLRESQALHKELRAISDTLEGNNGCFKR